MFELANVSRPGVSEYISGSGALSALDSRLEGFKNSFNCYWRKIICCI